MCKLHTWVPRYTQLLYIHFRRSARCRGTLGLEQPSHPFCGAF